MAGPYAVDASFLLNAFITSETGSEVSREVLSRLQSQAVPLVAPALLLPETAAAISRGGNSAEYGRQFASHIQRLPHLILVPLDLILAQQAVNIAANHRLRGSDAVYAAVAEQFACPLITLDREQHDRVAKVMQTYYPVELLNSF
jgi:predicted nucleic acid-binding protein